jgi:putative tryptophan/tyrosine transport system substrate-binding protein
MYTMKKAGLLSILFVVALLAVAVIAEAQQPRKTSRIGLLSGSGPATNPAVLEAFRQGLRELGYVEGGNILLEYRWADGKLDRLPGLAVELVGLRADVIVTVGTQATLAARQASNTIPIVAAGAGDLVGSGLVESLARPGGNVTGSTNIDPDLSAKRLELLKETFPKLSRVAIPYHGGPGGDEDELQESQAAAKKLKVQVQSYRVQNPTEFERAYAAITKERTDALIIFHGNFTSFHRRQLIELAGKNRLPTMCGQPSWSEDGGLISYGHDRRHQYRRAAYFVDKILKGTKPADLPVEQPMKFELVINLKTAKQIGLTIPPNVLVRADKVIK